MCAHLKFKSSRLVAKPLSQFNNIVKCVSILSSCLITICLQLKKCQEVVSEKNTQKNAKHCFVAAGKVEATS